MTRVEAVAIWVMLAGTASFVALAAYEKGKQDGQLVGVHITYGATMVRRGDLPKVLRDELDRTPIARTNP